MWLRFVKRLGLVVFIGGLIALYCWPRPFSCWLDDDFTYLYSAIRLVDDHAVFYTNELMQKYADPAFAPVWYTPVSETSSVIKYPPGFTLLLALCYVVGGRTAMLYLNPILALLGLWLVYRLGVRLFSRRVGWIAVILLGLNPMYLAMASTQYSHLTATVCLLLAMSLWFQPGHRIAGPLREWFAGAALGYAIFTHLTSALFVIPFLAHCIVKKEVRPRFFLALVASLGLIAGYDFVTAGHVLGAYAFTGEPAMFHIKYVIENLAYHLGNLHWFTNTQPWLALLSLTQLRRELRVFFLSLILAMFGYFLPYYYPGAHGLWGWSFRFLFPLYPVFALLAAHFINGLRQHRWTVPVSIGVILTLNAITLFAIDRHPLIQTYNEQRVVQRQWECVANNTAQNAVILSGKGGQAVLLAGRIAYEYHRTTPYELLHNVDDMLRSRDVYLFVMPRNRRVFLRLQPFFFPFPSNDTLLSTAYELQPTVCGQLYRLSRRDADTPS